MVLPRIGIAHTFVFVLVFALTATGLQRTSPEIVVHPIYFRSSDSFAPNHRVAPFDDINVRRALKMALDNETVVGRARHPPRRPRSCRRRSPCPPELRPAAAVK